MTDKYEAALRAIIAAPVREEDAELVLARVQDVAAAALERPRPTGPYERSIVMPRCPDCQGVLVFEDAPARMIYADLVCADCGSQQEMHIEGLPF